MKSDFLYYIHPEVAVNYDGNSYYVSAKSGIPKGSVLLIEQGLVETKDCIKSLMMQCQEIYPYVAELYPRDINKYTTELIDAKLMYNSWDWDNGKIGVFFQMSKFNHSCDPNAFFAQINRLSTQGGLQVIVLIAVQDIYPNQEITIQYHTNAGHGCPVFNWKCDCHYTKRERKGIFREYMFLSREWRDHHLQSILSIIEFNGGNEGRKSILLNKISDYLTNSVESLSSAMELNLNLSKDSSAIDLKLEDNSIDMSDSDCKECDYDPDPNSEMLSYALQTFDEDMIASCLDNNCPIEPYDKKRLAGFVKTLCQQSSDYNYVYEKLVAYARRNNDQVLLSSI